MATKSKTTKRQIGLRLPERLRQRIEKAAQKRGVSMNSEIVLRLEDSFAREDRLGGAGVAGILELLGATMKSTGTLAAALATHGLAKDGAWLDHPYSFDQACKAAVTVLEAHRPPGKIVLPNLETPPGIGDDPAHGRALLTQALEDLGRLMGSTAMELSKQGGENE